MESVVWLFLGFWIGVFTIGLFGAEKADPTDDYLAHLTLPTEDERWKLFHTDGICPKCGGVCVGGEFEKWCNVPGCGFVSRRD